MATQWVSYEELKRKVSIADILEHYGLLKGLRRRGDELIGLCPFHRERKGSFRANVQKNAFKCWGGSCGKQGNILE